MLVSINWTVFVEVELFKRLIIPEEGRRDQWSVDGGLPEVNWRS